MTKIEVKNPRELGIRVKFSIENLFKLFGDAIQASASPSPLAWLKGLGVVVTNLGRIKVESSLDGKAYLWVCKSFANAIAGVLRDNHATINQQFDGEWRSVNQERFDAMFSDTPLVIDLDFLRSPRRTQFVETFLKHFGEWSIEAFNLNDATAKKLEAALEERLFEELMSEFHNGNYREIIEHIRHALSETEVQEDARRNYKKYLKSLYQRKVLNEAEMRLSDIYIEPKFYLHAHCLREHDSRLALRIRSEESNKETFLVDSKFPGTIHEYLHHFLNEENELSLKGEKPPKLLVLLGHPGQGKSSFCMRFLYDYLNYRYELKKPIYHIRLREIRKVNTLLRDPEEALKNYVRRFEENRQKTTINFGPGEFFDAIWVLDGFDELVMKEDISEENVDHFLAELARLSRRANGPQIILTSRLGYIREDRIRWADTVVLELAKMSLEDQQTWLAKYRQFYLDVTLNLNAEKLAKIDANEIQKLRGIKSLIQQPILLHMVLTSGIDLVKISNQADLYHALFNNLVNRVVSRSWDDESVPGLEGISEGQLREFLQDIALAIFHADGEVITEKELQDHPSTKTFREALQVQQLQKSLKYVLVAIYFQSLDAENDGAAAYEFLHKSFQEYLTAEKIWSCFKDLADQKSNGDFFIRDAQKALQEFYPLLAKKSISQEIMDFLLEMIGNTQQNILERLYMQMEKFSRTLFEVEFLLKFDAETEDSPTARISNVAFVYILIWVEVNRILPKEKQKKFPLIPVDLLALIGEKHPQWLYLRGLDLRDADLCDAFLSLANLRDSDLRDSDLSDSNLRNADLRDADLRGAYLFDADLRDANLRKAVLRGAVLRRAVLHDADLSDTDLRWTDLREADFRGADLRGADLREADLTNTDLRDAILRGAHLNGVIGLR